MNQQQDKTNNGTVSSSTSSESEMPTISSPRSATFAMIESLRHAALCFDATCHQRDCAKLKKLIRHRKSHCARSQLTSCATCKHLMALCCYHSKHCDHQDPSRDCDVPYCREIKAKLRTTSSNVTSSTTTRRIQPPAGDEMRQRNRDEIQKRLETLYHVCECENDADCPLAGCAKLKRLVEHNRDCSGDYFGGPCARCRTLMALCCYHAKHCTIEGYCPIPNCERIKGKLRQRSNCLESRLLIL